MGAVRDVAPAARRFCATREQMPSLSKNLFQFMTVFPFEDNMFWGRTKLERAFSA